MPAKHRSQPDAIICIELKIFQPPALLIESIRILASGKFEIILTVKISLTVFLELQNSIFLNDLREATRIILFGTRSLRPVVTGEASLVPLLVSRVWSRESVILVVRNLWRVFSNVSKK